MKVTKRILTILLTLSFWSITGNDNSTNSCPLCYQKAIDTTGNMQHIMSKCPIIIEQEKYEFKQKVHRQLDEFKKYFFVPKTLRTRDDHVNKVLLFIINHPYTSREQRYRAEDLHYNYFSVGQTPFIKQSKPPIELQAKK